MAIASAALHPLAVTGIGSMPHLSVADALPGILATQDLPAVPQLPSLGSMDGLHAEALAGLPGIGVGDDGTVTLPTAFNKTGAAPCTSSALAALRLAAPPGWPLKSQVAGPVTLALNTRLADGRQTADDRPACDMLANYLAAAVADQAPLLNGGMLLLDEPDLAVALSDARLGPEWCRSLLALVLNAAMGPVGVHTCGEPDVAFLASLPADIIGIDAYRYGDSLSAAPLQQLLLRGGWIAWGIVPSEAEPLARATTESLTFRLQHAWTQLAGEGVSRPRLVRQALITPACGLGLLSVPEADRALQLARSVADTLKATYARDLAPAGQRP